MVKNPPAIQETQETQHGFDPWVGKIPWRRKWQPTPIFLPGEFQGQRSLAGYSPWGHKESDMTERLTLSLFTHNYSSPTTRAIQTDLRDVVGLVPDHHDNSNHTGSGFLVPQYV